MTDVIPLVTVRYWAGAKQAAGRESEQLRAASVGDLITTLMARDALARVLSACSLLVDNQASRPGTVLRDGAIVDVLPPFAGG